MKSFLISTILATLASVQVWACAGADRIQIYHKWDKTTLLAEYNITSGLMVYRSIFLEKIQFRFFQGYRVDSHKRTSGSVCANEQCTRLNKLENEHLLATYTLGGISYSTLIPLASVRVNPPDPKEMNSQQDQGPDWNSIPEGDTIRPAPCAKTNILN